MGMAQICLFLEKSMGLATFVYHLTNAPRHITFESPYKANIAVKNLLELGTASTPWGGIDELIPVASTDNWGGGCGLVLEAPRFL